MRIARFLWTLFFGVCLAALIQSLFVYYPPEPEDLPWTPLDLRAPVGLATGMKLAALERDPHLCRALLGEAGVKFSALPGRREGASCGWRDAVRMQSGPNGPRPGVTLSCPLGAGVEVWMRAIVQPAATEMLGTRVVGIDDLGSYACRRTYGQREGNWSEHATANAVDIAGFRLADGRRISVLRDWRDEKRGAFLRHVRDGACRLFATTLSPDYNAAHRNHLHLDMAPRGSVGWRMCA